ncbi:MAG: prepilin-type N-terminal cleavage/methylation domain-containing protein, partial [Patescibacteria group bacterium]
KVHKTNMSQKRGFTLIELLVVISIIAILSIIGMTVYGVVQKSARDARRRGDLHAIAQALEQYKAANGIYPGSSGQFFSCWNSQWAPSGNTAFYDVLVPKYIQTLPVDPINKEGGIGNFLGDNSPTDLCYHYQATTDGTSFNLGTNLESDTTVETGNDPQFGNYQVKNQQ